MHGGKIVGGKIVGQGGQGCVVSPAWTTLKNSSAFVTKIASKSTTDKEFSLSKYLMSIDPEQKHGIYAIETNCSEISQNMWKREGLKHDGQRCDELSRRTDTCFATYPKYINDLDGKLPKSMSPNDIVRALVDLWKSLAFLHEHDIIHGDIKHGNIAIQRHSRRYIFAYADWGWSAHIPDQTSASKAYTSMKNKSEGYFPKDGGIWSPKVFGSSSRDFQKLLRFNDVFGLAYECRDDIDIWIEEGNLQKNSQIMAFRSLMNTIFKTEPLDLRASDVVRSLEKLLPMS